MREGDDLYFAPVIRFSDVDESRRSPHAEATTTPKSETTPEPAPKLAPPPVDTPVTPADAGPPAGSDAPKKILGRFDTEAEAATSLLGARRLLDAIRLPSGRLPGTSGTVDATLGRPLQNARVAEEPARYAADPHYRAVRDALASGRMTPERAEALGHFKTYPGLRPAPASTPPTPPSRKLAELLTRIQIGDEEVTDEMLVEAFLPGLKAKGYDSEQIQAAVLAQVQAGREAETRASRVTQLETQFFDAHPDLNHHGVEPRSGVAMDASRLWHAAGGFLLGFLLAWLVGVGGLYRTHTARIGPAEVLYRVNRVTGAVSLCVGATGCRAVPELPADP